MAFWFEKGVVPKSLRTTACRFNESLALAFNQVFFALLNQANDRTELRSPGFFGCGAHAFELRQKLGHVALGVAMGTGIARAEDPRRPFEGLDLQTCVVREAIEPVVGDDVAGFELGIALKGRSVLDDFLVAADVGQALDAVPVAEHFLEFAHLVGVVRGEHENGQLVVLGVAHAAKVRRRRDRDKGRG